MNHIDKCPVCGHNEFSQFRSTVLSSFVVDRMTGKEINPNNKHTPSVTFMCGKCYFAGVGLRFTKEEEQRYYHDYMGEEYNAHRDAYEGEGWRMYEQYYKTPEYINNRKQTAFKVLDKVLDVSMIETVLDFGGDTGEMMPDELNKAKRYVCDVNQHKLVDGVTAITSPADCKPIELLMCSHVLEHVSDPLALLEEMKSYMAPNGCIYIEVPEESPSMLTHEHINFMTYQFLCTFLSNNGFNVLSVTELNYAPPMTRSLAIVGQLI